MVDCIALCVGKAAEDVAYSAVEVGWWRRVGQVTGETEEVFGTFAKGARHLDDGVIGGLCRAALQLGDGGTGYPGASAQFALAPSPTLSNLSNVSCQLAFHDYHFSITGDSRGQQSEIGY